MNRKDTLARLTQLLLDMELVSEAPTARLGGATINKTKSESKPPRTAGDPLIDDWLRLINSLCQAGELTLEWYKRRRPGRNLDRVDRQRRILSAYEGQPPIFVAFVEGVSEDHVRRLRKQHNLRIEDGLPRAETSE